MCCLLYWSMVGSALAPDPPRSHTHPPSAVGRGFGCKTLPFVWTVAVSRHPKLLGAAGGLWGQREGAEWVPPSYSSPAPARCGQWVPQRTLAGGLFLCRGSAGSPSRGGEHPPRGRNFLHRDIFSETQSEWKGAGGRRQINIGRSCTLPRAFVPRAMRSQGTAGPVRGQWGHPWDLPPSWEQGRSAGGVFASQPIAWLRSSDAADTKRCCVWSSR